MSWLYDNDHNEYEACHVKSQLSMHKECSEYCSVRHPMHTCIIDVSLGLSLLLSSAVVGGGWAGLLIDMGVVDTSRTSNGGSGALKTTTKYKYTTYWSQTILILILPGLKNLVSIHWIINQSGLSLLFPVLGIRKTSWLNGVVYFASRFCRAWLFRKKPRGQRAPKLVS